MDMTPTIQPNSDQINADDLIAGDRTVTITAVEAGNKEQPVFVHLSEYPGRTYRPGKSMRRVLIAAWGAEASAYIGRRMTLYRDPTIKFGPDAVGGIRIRAMSNLTEPLTVPLTITRGKRSPFTVQPLTDDTLDAALADIESAQSIATLRTAWDLAGKRGVQSHPDVVAAKERRKAELS